MWLKDRNLWSSGSVGPETPCCRLRAGVILQRRIPHQYDVYRSYTPRPARGALGDRCSPTVGRLLVFVFTVAALLIHNVPCGVNKLEGALTGA